MSAARGMPRYQSHKKVWALKIAALDRRRLSMTPGDEGYAETQMPQEWFDKHQPEVGGYLVVYDDGYQSFSPAKPFEEGYSRL